MRAAPSDRRRERTWGPRGVVLVAGVSGSTSEPFERQCTCAVSSCDSRSATGQPGLRARDRVNGARVDCPEGGAATVAIGRVTKALCLELAARGTLFRSGRALAATRGRCASSRAGVGGLRGLATNAGRTVASIASVALSPFRLGSNPSAHVPIQVLAGSSREAHAVREHGFGDLAGAKMHALRIPLDSSSPSRSSSVLASGNGQRYCTSALETVARSTAPAADSRRRATRGGPQAEGSSRTRLALRSSGARCASSRARHVQARAGSTEPPHRVCERSAPHRVSLAPLRAVAAPRALLHSSRSHSRDRGGARRTVALARHAVARDPHCAGAESLVEASRSRVRRSISCTRTTDAA